MGRKFIPVISRERFYKLYQLDLKTLRCFKRAKLPLIPKFECQTEDDEMDFNKEMDQ
jgi:hypothetical protein